MNKFVFKLPSIDILDIYHQHQQIWKIFSNEKVCPKYRVDGTTITVLSETNPTESISCSMSKIPQYDVGTSLKFKWRAYVEKRKFVRNGKGPNVAIRDYPGILAWVNRVSDLNGFKVSDFQVVSNPYVLIGRKPGHEIRCNAVDFEGVLEVCNTEKFNEAVQRGAGPAKLGFGVLCIQS